MKLTFKWPNDNSEQDSEFIVRDYSYTQCYYNELLPADNYASVSIPWDTSIANKLRQMKDDNIKATIKDNQDSPVFTGYVDNGIDFTKAQRMRPISLKLISPSFLLRQAIGETIVFKSQSVTSIVTQLLSRLSGVPYNDFSLPAVIPVVVAQEDEEYHETIKTILFEYGYVFDFDKSGKFTVMPIFNQPSSVSNVFNGGNIRNQAQEICNKKEYNHFRVKFLSVSVNSGDLVYEDTAEKEVPKGLYFGHESESGAAQLVDNGAVYCEYQSSKGELLWADVAPDNFTVLTNNSAAFVIEKSGSLSGEPPTSLGNKGTSYAFRAKNASSYAAKIKEIKAVGTSYTGVECYEISKNGNLLKEYDSKYLQDKSYAAAFTKNISNYYRYSSIKLKLESYDDFAYGDFVKVSEAGIGEITARIVRKTYRMNAPISYELESVTEFAPASITGEETHGAASANNSGRGPDIDPPAPPSNLSLTLRDDGKVIGLFTKSSDDDIHFYTVYRKTPDMPYKTVLTLDSDTNNFVDESSINGMAYTYKVIATDTSGNVSNPSGEKTIGTVTADRPLGPASASANAYEEYIAVSIVPPTLASSGRDIYAPAEYKIQISRDNGTTYSDVAVTANTSYDYYFDRTVDGYPEIGTLGLYRFRMYSVNIYGNTSSSAFVCPVSTGDYATWTPAKPVLKGSGTGRTLYLEWGRQLALFGTVAYRVQISLNGTAWYKPSVTKDPYAAEDNYREDSTANAFLETTEAAYFQTVPLTGQNTALPAGGYSISPRDYYYRVKAVNTESGKSSDWSTAINLTAKGTSAQDMLNNSVGWDQIIDKSVLFEKLGAKNFIGQKSILALIANDDDLSDKERAGFQYWALDTITVDGVKYNKGEFRINTDTGDFFIVDPVTGISFKASKIDIDSLGANVYGNFSVFDKKGADGLKQLEVGLVRNNGFINIIPEITIGNESKKPIINIYSREIRIWDEIQGIAVGTSESSRVHIKGFTIDFQKEGYVKAQLKLAAIAGVLSLAAIGLPLACEGITSAGDIKKTEIEHSWTAVSNSTFGTRIILSIAYGGGKFVAGGSYGKAAYSTDGVTWTAVSNSTFGTNYIYGIAYGDGRFVAVCSSGKVEYSTDGVNWTAVSDSTFGTSIILSIAYGDGKFVAGGYYGKAAYSTDGVTWTAVSNSTFGTNNINGIAYGGGKFVAVGPSGKAAYSTDGVTWTAVSDPNFMGPSEIAYGGGKFVAVGPSGKAAYSTDGVTWTAVSNSTFGTDDIYGIAYGDGRFVAVFEKGKAAYSTNGVTWAAVGDSTFGTIDITDIEYGNGKFIAGGHDGKMAYGAIITAQLVLKPDGTVGWVKG